MRLTNDSFISSNDLSIDEFSVLIDDTNCFVMSKIAAIIESDLSTGTFGESPCLLESSIVISTGFCLFVDISTSIPSRDSSRLGCLCR